jgi:hypothetical protein
MLIQSDKEGKQVITNLVDIALRGAGIQALQLANTVLINLKEIEEENKQ